MVGKSFPEESRGISFEKYESKSPENSDYFLEVESVDIWSILHWSAIKIFDNY